MDCAKGWPRCGFDYAYSEHEDKLYTRARLAGQSPSGRDAVRLTAIPGTSTQQYEWGWIYTPRSAVPQGATRYVRWRFRIGSPVAWRSAAGKSAGGKLVILGNLCEKPPHGPTRVISNIDWREGGAMLRTEQNIAGPPSRFDVTRGLPPDVWHSVQLAVKSSSGPADADGMLALYLNQDNASEATPTAKSSGGFPLLTAGWSTADGCRDSGIAFGNTFNALASGQNLVLDVADFEYAETFDPSWGGK